MSVLSTLNGTLVNAAAVIVGSLMGFLIGKGLSERVSKAVMCAVGFCTVYIGVTGCFKGQNTLVIILSLVFGTLIGEGFDLDKQINRLGGFVEKKLNHGDNHLPIAEGFVNASLLFCVGAMTVVGSLNSGLRNDHTTLYAKACIDLISASVFASTMGMGVALSAFTVLVSQGSIALLANVIAPLLSDAVIGEMTAVGSLLIIGLSFNLLGFAKLKIINFIPSIFLPMLLCPAYDLVVGWLSNWI